MLPKRFIISFLLLAGSVLFSEPGEIKHSFAPGQYPDWRKGGELLVVNQLENAVELQASELSFARLIRNFVLTPGRTYRISVQGSGPMNICIRRTGEGARNDVFFADVFKQSPIFTFQYTPPAEYPAKIRLMLCPAERNVPARVEGFAFTPLGQTAVPAALQKETLDKVIQPSKVRGFVFPDGTLTEKRMKEGKRLHGNFFRVRFRDEQDLSRAEVVCKLARKYGVKITLEFMHGGDALNRSRAFAGLLKKYKDEIWAVRPSGENSTEGLAAFRKMFPDVPVIQELVNCQPSELVDDCHVVYCTRIADRSALTGLKRLLARYAVPVLVNAPAEMAQDVERENWNFALEVTEQTLPAAGISAERELVKNASPAEMQRSIVRAVQRVRKPDSLVCSIITDTHYQSRPPFSVSRFNYSYIGSLQTMQVMADVAKAAKADFVGHCGDVVDGVNPGKNIDQDLQTVMKTLQSSGLPVLLAKGNHDDGSLWAARVKQGNVVHSQADWFRTVVQKTLDAGAVGDDSRPAAGYYYMDFPSSRTRVIVLNCSENSHELNPDGTLKFHSIGITDIGARQINWLAGKALNFRDKADRTKWGVLFIAHISLSQDTMPNVRTLNGVLQAFLDGGIYAGESYPGVCGVDPGKVSCDFTDQGPMKIYGSFYGHHHRLYVDSFYRHNGRLLELNFPTALARQNELGTGNGNGFAMLVLNPGENKLYLFRYGRGSDGVYPLTQQ